MSVYDLFILLSFKNILFEHSDVGGAAINSQIGCALHMKLYICDDKLLHRRREKKNFFVLNY